MLHELKHPLCAVEYRNGISFGGSQMQSPNRLMSGYGCGIVAAQEVLMYLSRHHSCPGKDFFGEMIFDSTVSAADYNTSLELLRRYFTIIPPFGISGIALTFGLNSFFRRYGFPYRSSWKISSGSFYPSLSEMLDKDIPVIISVGPNLPAFWQKKSVKMTPAGNRMRATPQNVYSHYVIAVGLDEENLYVSSWGKRFSISRSEYDEYVRRISNSIVSNLVYIHRR